MKKVVRNDLWMMIIAWCLVLNSFSLMGIITSLLASLYLFFSLKNKNYWRFIAVTLISSFLSFLLVYLTATNSFDYFPAFCFTISINVAILNERLHKESLGTIYPIFMCLFLSLIIFILLGTLVSLTLKLESAKVTLFGIIILVFIPYASIFVSNLLLKEYKIQRYLKNKTQENSIV